MTPAQRPPLLTTLAGLVGLEALGVTGYTVWFGIQFFVAPTGSLSGALFLLALFVAMSAWLWILAVGLVRMRTWTRAGTLVWQTIQVVIGASMINAEGDWFIVALVMIVLGALGGVFIFTPRVSRAIAREPRG